MIVFSQSSITVLRCPVFCFFFLPVLINYKFNFSASQELRLILKANTVVKCMKLNSLLAQEQQPIALRCSSCIGALQNTWSSPFFHKGGSESFAFLNCYPCHHSSSASCCCLIQIASAAPLGAKCCSAPVFLCERLSYTPAWGCLPQNLKQFFSLERRILFSSKFFLQSQLMTCSAWSG